MRLRPPTLPRALLAAVLMCGLVMAPAGAAFAHTGSSTSDYRVEITGWVGDHRGVDLRIIELGNRVELRRTTASTVIVLGYEGEPYLRLDAYGVAENTTSPAHFLNQSRYASSDPPATASAKAPPTWMTISNADVVRWHDHRAHWMSNVPRADVLANPDVERVVLDGNRMDLVIDGRSAAALVRVTWLPPPLNWVWWAVAAVLAFGVSGVIVFLPGAVRAVATIAAVGSAVTLLGQGTSTMRQVLALACVALALCALGLRRHPHAHLPALAAAASATILAATRLDVFNHELVAGRLPGEPQRVMIAVGAGLCIGTLASALVGAMGPTPEPRGAS